ncbi:outer membrane beta-barrel protein [Neolewinella agarilytica]|uniref:Outer membrane protein beta-barrel domain-containing protein n=1 Tax=Neolewinella agarilytica TaxID=478744 RepID=A0A1H9GNF2_9BACT|nr:outer membrane beta-barrel protein [Neolewinella agarilytica]SEQ51616.1 Outer membrane protein beta-barrel domain-containing protein [Neolewinella agarilytica]
MPDYPFIPLFALLIFLCLCPAFLTGQDQTDSISQESDQLKMGVSFLLSAYRFDDFTYDPTILLGVRVSRQITTDLLVAAEFRVGTPEDRFRERGLLGNVNLNINYQFFPIGKIRPYAGLAVGYYDITGFQDRIPDTQFAAGGTVGLTFPFGTRVSAFTEVQYTNFFQAEVIQRGQPGASFGLQNSF